MIANSRNGKNTGSVRLRITASTSANTRTSTSAMRNTLMFTRKPAKILGSVSTNLSALKKTVWKRASQARWRPPNRPR